MDIVAHHEAGHIVITYASQFHIVTLAKIISDTTGFSDIGISKQKLHSFGIDIDDFPLRNHDICVENAIINYAGYEAEKKFCQINNLQDDFSHAINDYQIARLSLQQAIPPNLYSEEFLIETAHQLVESRWNAICLIAAALLEAEDLTLYGYEINDILNPLRIM